MLFLDKLREKTVKKGKNKAKKDFFDPASSAASTVKKDQTFYDMELSRPILKVTFFLIIFINFIFRPLWNVVIRHRQLFNLLVFQLLLLAKTSALAQLLEQV